MNQTYIIAEAGVNHNGCLDTALKLVKAAHECGANAVKFQTFNPSSCISIHAKQAKYQEKNTQITQSQIDMIKPFVLSLDDHKRLQEKAYKLGLDFLSTPFDISSALLLQSLGLSTYKVASGEITNLPLLRTIASIATKVLLSTGMSTMDEVKAGVDVLINSGIKKENLIILQANTQYPSPIKDTNLKAMQNMGKELGVKYGLSDHSLGCVAAIGAVAMGACVIEKHLTLDNFKPGPDHKASANPRDFAHMVEQIRQIELALGDGIKRPSKSEIENKEIARKVLVAAKKIKKGEILNLDNLCCKRAGEGISPMKIELFIGKSANKDYEEDEIIQDFLAKKPL